MSCIQRRCNGFTVFRAQTAARLSRRYSVCRDCLGIGPGGRLITGQLQCARVGGQGHSGVIDRWFPRGRSPGLGKSVAAFEESLALDPNYAPVWAGLAEALMQQSGMAYAPLEDGFKKAREALQRALEQIDKMQEKFWRNWAELLIRYGLRHESNKESGLKDFITENGHDSAVQIAQVYALHGDTDKALHWLEVGLKQRDTGLAQTVLSDRIFVGLYGNSRFEAIVDKIGLLEAFRNMPPKKALVKSS